MRFRDGDWELFDYDFSTGRQVWVTTNDDGSMTFRTDYPVDATVDANAAQRNMARPDWQGDFHMVASIPMGIVHGELQGAIEQDDQRYLSKWLNDSDNRAWRTKEGTV